MPDYERGLPITREYMLLVMDVKVKSGYKCPLKESGNQ